MQVLIDGNFIAMCMQMKVDIHERLPKFLQVKPHECELYVAAAALKELELLGDAMRPAFEVAQSFKVVHADKDIETSKDGTPVDVSKVMQAIVGMILSYCNWVRSHFQVANVILFKASAMNASSSWLLKKWNCVRRCAWCRACRSCT